MPLRHDADAALVVASRREFDGQLLTAARAAGAAFVRARVTAVSRHGGGFRIDHGRRPDVRHRHRHRRRRRRQPGASRAWPRRFAAISCRSPPDSSRTASPRTKSHSSCSAIRPATSGRSRASIIWRSASARRRTAGVTAPALRARAAAWIERDRHRRRGAARAVRLADPVARGRGFRPAHAGRRRLAAASAMPPGWSIRSRGKASSSRCSRPNSRSSAIERSAACPTMPSSVQDADRSGAGRAARLKAGFFRPEFNALVMDALERQRTDPAHHGRLVAGVQPYRTLKWRLLQDSRAHPRVPVRRGDAAPRPAPQRARARDRLTRPRQRHRAAPPDAAIADQTRARRRTRRRTHPHRKETVRISPPLVCTDRPAQHEQRWYNRCGHSVLTLPLA